MKEEVNYYNQKEQEEAKKYFGQMIGAYMLQEQDENNPRLVIRKDDIEKLKALLFMIENLINRNKELEENYDKLTKHFIDNHIPKSKAKEKVIEIKNKPVKDEFITATQGKLDTIIAIEQLLED